MSPVWQSRLSNRSTNHECECWWRWRFDMSSSIKHFVCKSCIFSNQNAWNDSHWNDSQRSHSATTKKGVSAQFCVRFMCWRMLSHYIKYDALMPQTGFVLFLMSASTWSWARFESLNSRFVYAVVLSPDCISFPSYSWFINSHIWKNPRRFFFVSNLPDG